MAFFDAGLQELADRYGKRVSPCYFTGDNFRLITENYEPLFASFSHISRNIISHAIDTPELRAARNKAPELTVIIETKKYIEAGNEWFQISFEDDGGGLNVDLLRSKIAVRSSAEEAARLTSEEVMSVIFEENLSTKESVDELAGRGVGLSAVKHEAKKLGGRVSVESESGIYTKIIIDVPLDWSNPQLG